MRPGRGKPPTPQLDCGPLRTLDIGARLPCPPPSTRPWRGGRPRRPVASQQPEHESRRRERERLKRRGRPAEKGTNMRLGSPSPRNVTNGALYAGGALARARSPLPKRRAGGIPDCGGGGARLLRPDRAPTARPEGRDVARNSALAGLAQPRGSHRVRPSGEAAPVSTLALGGPASSNGVERKARHIASICRTDILAPVLELAILGLLKEHPMHGYDLRKRLRGDFGLLSSLSFGSLYPALARLEATGAVHEVPASTSAEPGTRQPGTFSSAGSIAGERAAFRARLASRRVAASRSGTGTRGRRVLRAHRTRRRAVPPFARE